MIRDGKATVEELIAQRVRIRTLELLRATALTGEITDGTVALSEALESNGALALELRVEPIDPSERKARVAIGLLEALGAPGIGERVDTAPAGRHGVLGFDLRVADSGRELPWYRPFGPLPKHRPERMDQDTLGAPPR